MRAARAWLVQLLLVTALLATLAAADSCKRPVAPLLFRSVGELCTPDAPCRGDLYCVDEVCVDTPPILGSSCASQPLNACGTGAYCDTATNTCLPRIVHGHQCRRAANINDNSAQCEDGYVCVVGDGQEVPGSVGVCRTIVWRGAGESCAVGSENQCRPTFNLACNSYPMTCVANTCVATGLGYREVGCNNATVLCANEWTCVARQSDTNESITLCEGLREAESCYPSVPTSPVDPNKRCGFNDDHEIWQFCNITSRRCEKSVKAGGSCDRLGSCGLLSEECNIVNPTAQVCTPKNSLAVGQLAATVELCKSGLLLDSQSRCAEPSSIQCQADADCITNSPGAEGEAFVCRCTSTSTGVCAHVLNPCDIQRSAWLNAVERYEPAPISLLAATPNYRYGCTSRQAERRFKCCQRRDSEMYGRGFVPSPCDADLSSDDNEQNGGTARLMSRIAASNFGANASSSLYFQVLNGEVYFAATSPETESRVLWKVNNHRVVADRSSGPGDYDVGVLVDHYFFEPYAINVGIDIKSVVAAPAHQLVYFAGHLTATHYLFHTNGTLAGTQVTGQTDLPTINMAYLPSANKLLFTKRLENHNYLYSLDVGGQSQEVTPAVHSVSSNNPRSYIVVSTSTSNHMFFVSEPDPSQNVSIWRTDGTPEGSVPLLVQRRNATALVSCGAFAYYSVDSETGTEHQLIAFNSSDSHAVLATTFEGQIVCVDNGRGIALFSSTEHSLYRTDGVASERILQSGSVSLLAANSFGCVGSLAIFASTDGTNGKELWYLDFSTTPSSPHLVSDLYPGQISSDPHTFMITDSDSGVASTTHFMAKTRDGPGVFYVRQGPDGPVVRFLLHVSDAKFFFTDKSADAILFAAAVKDTPTGITAQKRMEGLAWPVYGGLGLYAMRGCGNGIVGEDEECDGGDCCDPETCKFLPAGATQTCAFRDSPFTCTGTAGQCTGSSSFCQRPESAPGVLPVGTLCRASEGDCDPQEVCDGLSGDCPADTRFNATVVCRGSLGLCDPAETCDGVSAACPDDARVPEGTPCRASRGVCDAVEKCDGLRPSCPADARVANGTSCRNSTGLCDPAEVCNGVSDECPVDSKAAAGAVCRASQGDCDVAETCDGSSASCPPDSLQQQGLECRASRGDCDKAEVCDGSSAVCPTDIRQANGTSCRASLGDCDPEETCSGSSDACPADVRFGASKVCRESAGDCDKPETCDGVSAACPANVLLANNTQCRAPRGDCDKAEVCDGVTPACPADALAPNGAVCRIPRGDCDKAEVCDGVSVGCPADVRHVNGTSCRASLGDCDPEEVCNGVSDACPSDIRYGPSKVCRASLGDCDRPESCDGVSALCPADVLVANNTECRASRDLCDKAEKCDGVSAVCPSDVRQPSGATCRVSLGLCDPEEVCDGASDACPADVRAAATVPCRAARGDCDRAEMCDGSSAACPSDVRQPNGTSCRHSLGLCDPEEVCDGMSDACPADVRAAAGAVCREARGLCDIAETCDGHAVNCPVDMLRPVNTKCSSPTATCRAESFCSGSNVECPTGRLMTRDEECRLPKTACSKRLFCDGVNEQCSASAPVPRDAGSLCEGSSVGPCAVSGTCDGTLLTCPVSPHFRSAGTKCSVVVNDTCTDYGQCDGDSATCEISDHCSDGTADSSRSSGGGGGALIPIVIAAVVAFILVLFCVLLWVRRRSRLAASASFIDHTHDVERGATSGGTGRFEIGEDDEFNGGHPLSSRHKGGSNHMDPPQLDEERHTHSGIDDDDRHMIDDVDGEDDEVHQFQSLRQ